MDPTASGHFPKIWRKYQVIVEDATPGVVTRKQLDTDEFMDEARKSQVVVASGETSFQGSVILTAGEDSRAPVQPLLHKIGTVPSDATCCDRDLDCPYESCVDVSLNPDILRIIQSRQPFSAGGKIFYNRDEEFSTKEPFTETVPMPTNDILTAIPTSGPDCSEGDCIEGKHYLYVYENDNGDWGLFTITHDVSKQEAALQN